MKKLIISIILMFGIASAGAVYGKPTGGAHGFTPSDKAKVKKSFVMAVKRFAKPDVIKCVVNNAQKSYHDNYLYHYTKDELKDAMAFLVYGLDRLGVKGSWSNSNFKLDVMGRDLDDGVAGNAQLNYPGMEERPAKFRINLNRKIINSRSVEGTAGTIFHEMLHNTAYVGHPAGDYDKMIIKIWGQCIAGNGQLGLGLHSDRYSNWHD